MITIFTIAFNEEFFIKYMIDHYRERFPGCRVVVYDNYSTDNTVAIATENGAEVILYDTNNRLDDNKYLEIKNNCWKDATTDWILVCDVDELLNITAENLKFEESIGATIIKSEGYNMVNMSDNYDISQIEHGSRFPSYDKYYLFNKSKLKEINYTHGCHIAYPVGDIKLSDESYLLYHYKYINKSLILERYKLYANRLSDENLKHGWGGHYASKEQEIYEDWNYHAARSIKIRK
jgi:glycosyltransferase involved in cell wall biosynthesis